MTHRPRWFTMVGAAMLLALSSCGSDDAEPTPSPQEQTQPSTDQSTRPSAGDSTPEDTASAQDPTEGSAQEDPATAPEGADTLATSGYSTEPQESEGFPGQVTPGEGPQHLRAVRTGIHEGFERVVFEFAGEQTPAWRGEYTETARELGRGRTIDIAGEHILEINVNGPSWLPEGDPGDRLPSGEYYERGRGEVVEEIYIQGPFEAHSQYLIGLEEKRPFHIGLLEDPTRIVVDISAGSSDS